MGRSIKHVDGRNRGNRSSLRRCLLAPGNSSMLVLGNMQSGKASFAEGLGFFPALRGGSSRQAEQRFPRSSHGRGPSIMQAPVGKRGAGHAASARAAPPLKVPCNDSTQNAASIVFDGLHASTSRVAQFSAATRCRKPHRTGMQAMSVRQTRSGCSTATARSRRGCASLVRGLRHTASRPSRRGCERRASGHHFPKLPIAAGRPPAR